MRCCRAPAHSERSESPRGRARRGARAPRARDGADRRCVRRGAKRRACDALGARGDRRAGCGAACARAHDHFVDSARRFARYRRIQHSYVCRIGRRRTRFGRPSGARASPVGAALRRRGGGERAVRTRTARTPACARAARARPDDRYRRRATTSTDRTVVERRFVLILRGKTAPSHTGATQRASLRVTIVTSRMTACYLRPSPVVSPVPVTGRTVTMPDARAPGRTNSLMHLWAGLRCSTLRLT